MDNPDYRKELVVISPIESEQKDAANAQESNNYV